MPEQVKELNEQISKISVKELSKKYDAKRMAELKVYPTNIWKNEDEANYLTNYFQIIQKVYALASKNDEAIITFIN